MGAEPRPPLLSVRNLKTYFSQDEGTVKAVDGVNLDLYPGATLGIVGESGCGKSVTARPIDDSRSEEHTSELQSRLHLVCRLLLEKKKKTKVANLPAIEQ